MLARSLCVGLVACSTWACSSKTATAPAPEPAAPPPAPAASVDTTAEPAPSTTEKIHVRLGIAELRGIFAGIEKASRHWSPESSLDLTGQMQAMLLSLGFGPGFYESFDLNGQLAFDLRYPHTANGGSPRPQDIGLAGSLPTIDPRRLIQGMPPAYQPQPLSDGMWQFVDDGFQLLLREQPRALHLAATEDDFQLAGQLVEQLGAGRRIRAEASNLPKDELDPGSLLGLDADDPQAKALARVLADLSAVQFEMEIGDDRDVEVTVGATAPFSKLGLDPLGAPLQQPSALAQSLPGGAVGAIELSWGDPTLLLSVIDRELPLNQIPAPFNDLAASGVAGVREMLQSVRDEVIFAFYLSPKGEATVLLAAKTKDEATTRTALRKIYDTGKRAFDAHLVLVGQDTEQRYNVAYKPDGLRAAKYKADQFKVSVPKAMQQDAQAFAMFLGKKMELELVSLTAGDTAVVAIGAGARQMVTDIARSLGKTRKNHLESEGGLTLARRTTGGCQVCIAIDPVGALHSRLAALNHAEQTTERTAALRSLQKLGSIGQVAMSAVIRPDKAHVGMAAPQSFVFAEPKAASTVHDAWKLMDSPPPPSAPPAPSTKPGG